MDVYLIRHTTPKVAAGRCYGQYDVELATTYPQELALLKAKLPAGFENFKIYSSPLKRCFRLASDLGKKTIVSDKRLMELDFGDWEMRPWDEINSKALTAWMENFVQAPCPGGESYQALSKRVMEWWDVLVKNKPKEVLVVTHSGVIRCLLCHVLEISLSNSFRFAVDQGSVSGVSIEDNRYSVKYINR